MDYLNNYRAWEYRKGFDYNGKMYFGIKAIYLYTLGFIKFHYKRIINKK